VLVGADTVGVRVAVGVRVGVGVNVMGVPCVLITVGGICIVGANVAG
jgi:hypothetical protein